MIRREHLDTPGDALPRPHSNTYWLLPGRVLAGDHPDNGNPGALALRLEGLRSAGMSCFIDLTGAPAGGRGDYTLQAAEGRPVRREPFGIADFGVPTAEGMRRALDAIHAALGAGEGVYLHCRAGVGRTGTVAGCLLVELGFSGDEALALLARKWQVMAKRALCPRTPETEEQRRFVRHWRGPPA